MMSQQNRHAPTCCWLAPACTGAAAARPQNIWRCGNTYTDQPCDGGPWWTADEARERRPERRRPADARSATPRPTPWNAAKDAAKPRSARPAEGDA